MKSKLAVLLTAVMGFSIATIVFAQEAVKTDSVDTMQNSAVNEEINEAVNETANEEANEVAAVPAEGTTAPVANTEAPAAPAAY